MFRNLHRDDNCKGRTLAQVAIYFDPAVHQFDGMFHNGQSQPGPAHLARARPVHPGEALENATHILGRNAGPCVRNDNLHKAVRYPERLRCGPRHRYGYAGRL